MKAQDKKKPIQERIGFLLNNTSWAIRNHMQKHIHSQGIDLTPEHWVVLNWLWSNGSAYQQELAEATRKNKASMTRLIDGLVKRNFVLRKSDPDDRRKHLIEMTQEAITMMSKAMPKVLSEYQKIIQDITPEETEALKSAFGKIITRIKELEAVKT